MPINYVLLSFIVLFIFNFLYRIVGKYISEKNIVVYIGQNSLLFLFLNIAIISIYLALRLDTWYIVWPSILFITIISMLGFVNIGKKLGFCMNNSYLWVILVVAILMTPIILRPNLAIILLLELTYGLVLLLEALIFLFL